MSIPELRGAQRAYLFLSDDDVVSVADASRYGEACYLAGMEAAAQELDALARQAWANGAARECAALEDIALALRARITIPT